jgi:hypothetical protein
LCLRPPVSNAAGRLAYEHPGHGFARARIVIFWQRSPG